MRCDLNWMFSAQPKLATYHNARVTEGFLASRITKFRIDSNPTSAYLSNFQDDFKSMSHWEKWSRKNWNLSNVEDWWNRRWLVKRRQIHFIALRIYDNNYQFLPHEYCRHFHLSCETNVSCWKLLEILSFYIEAY